MTYRRSLDDECPHVPEGATNWETQEISRHWRNALSALDDVVARVVYEADRLLFEGGHKVPPEARDYRFERIGSGTITSRAIEAEAEMLALARVRDGAIHRLAMLTKETP